MLRAISFIMALAFFAAPAYADDESKPPASSKEWREVVQTLADEGDLVLQELARAMYYTLNASEKVYELEKEYEFEERAKEGEDAPSEGNGDSESDEADTYTAAEKKIRSALLDMSYALAALHDVRVRYERLMDPDLQSD